VIQNHKKPRKSRKQKIEKRERAERERQTSSGTLHTLQREKVLLIRDSPLSVPPKKRESEREKAARETSSAATAITIRIHNAQ